MYCSALRKNLEVEVVVVAAVVVAAVVVAAVVVAAVVVVAVVVVAVVVVMASVHARLFLGRTNVRHYSRISDIWNIFRTLFTNN